MSCCCRDPVSDAPIFSLFLCLATPANEGRFEGARGRAWEEHGRQTAAEEPNTQPQGGTAQPADDTHAPGQNNNRQTHLQSLGVHVHVVLKMSILKIRLISGLVREKWLYNECVTNFSYLENDSAHRCLRFIRDVGAFKVVSNDLSPNQPSTVNKKTGSSHWRHVMNKQSRSSAWNQTLQRGN